MHTSIRYVLTMAALVSTAISCTSESHAVLTVETIATGFTSPVHVTAPPGDSSRLFVVEQAGLIRIVVRSDNSIVATPFLDITGPVVSGGERGLFALAFHPDYASNGYFFVHYTGAGGHTVVSRFTVSGNPNVANAASEVMFFELTQPQGNHNGGMIAFRPDEAGNYLYIALGDGGGSGDPNSLAQNITNAYGTILRLDVDAGPGSDTSTPNVPTTNPFVGTAGLDAIWVYGLRNPWRFGFDRLTGDLYIGDVGQGALEEIDFQPSDSAGGENYGWDLLEGTADFDCVDCDGARATTTLPIYEYGRNLGQSVTGGTVYRGSEMPFHTGRYFSADFFGRMWYFQYDGTTLSDLTEVTSQLNPGGHNISSFGEDADGELYFTDFSGAVRRITDTDSVVLLADAWLEPSHTGRQLGTETLPYYTLSNAIAGTLPDGTLHIVSGDYSETGTFDGAATWVAEGGTVRIGVAGAGSRSAGSGGGFVSRATE